jgi:Thiamine pyrophosphate-requiring enzymes [acetolactate synthase, pyruvate dehydrogenase (cytochrome), glyoxylate carboligase, phosphonopyruvate decarboxylase]
MIKVSDYIVRFFEEKGLTDMFMVSGGGCMHLVDSFGSSSKIHYWCTEHEQAAAMAAEGYAKQKNGIGLCLTTSGPGATNTVTGVLDCWQDSTPVIFLSGQAKTTQTTLNSGVSGLRQFGVQEADIVSVVKSITKYAVEIYDPMDIRKVLEEAYWTATSGRPGPVWISVPLDIQSAKVEAEQLSGFEVPVLSYKPSTRDIEYVKEEMLKAKRPVIIAGHGVRLSGACDALAQFVNEHDIPVVMPFMGIDVLNDDNKSCIGRIGTKGSRAGNFTMQNSDLLISIGSRMSVSDTGYEFELFAREAKVVVVDIDENEHKKKTIRIDRLVISDAKAFIEAISSVLSKNVKYTEWLTICQNWKKKYPVVLSKYDDDSKGINYYKFVDLINKYSDKSTPVVSDAGSAFYVTAQAVSIKKGQRHITTGGTATMGFTLPAAIGVAIASPSSSVVGITGEGSFMQNMQEMETVRFNNLNVKLFVVENNGYFSIHQTQNRFFNGHYVGSGIESGVSFTDLKKLSDAFDVDFYDLQNIADCDRLIPTILKTNKPAIIRVNVTTDMSVIPTNSAKILPNGKMRSAPLEDMYPFLDREEFNKEMIIKPVKEE